MEFKSNDRRLKSRLTALKPGESIDHFNITNYLHIQKENHTSEYMKFSAIFRMLL
jgi:hypothetical protein